MTKQTINIGTSPNAGDGDTIRNGATKINGNFDEVYAALPASKVQSLTRDMTAASGAVAYTGVGFKPTELEIFAIIPGTTLGCRGFSDSSKTALVMCFYGSAFIQTPGGASMLKIPGDTSLATYQQADIVSYDADGFTLNWTKVGSVPANTATLHVRAKI